MGYVIVWDGAAPVPPVMTNPTCIGVLCRNYSHWTAVRLNVNGHLLPIRLKSEREIVHVHAHGLTLASCDALRVISTQHISAYAA